MSWENVDKVLNCKDLNLLDSIGEEGFSLDELRYLGLKMYNSAFKSTLTKDELIIELHKKQELEIHIKFSE